MPTPIAYAIHGHDNDSYMLQNAVDLLRCSVCGELLERPNLVQTSIMRKKLDVSATYDGYTIVSQRFVDEWQRCKATGITFFSLPNVPGYFSINANKVVEFDSARRKTRFEKFQSCCNRFHSIAGATPAFLKNVPECLSGSEAVRTDIMFGGGDEKHPLIIIPLGIGDSLKCAKLSGLVLSDVLV